MAAFGPAPFSGILWLPLLLAFTLHHHHHPTSAKTSTKGDSAEYAGLRDGWCAVRKGGGGLLLDCLNAPFNEVLQKVRAVGKEIVSVSARHCWPRTAVSLDGSVFINSTNLREVSLTDCALENIADGTFSRLRHLRKIILHSNIIAAFTAETFSGLGNLTKLDLDYNQILTLSTKPFANMINLEMLSMDHNKITRISNDTFYGLSKLKTLSLRYNLIDSINRSTFSVLRSLTGLLLGQNKLEKITNGTFQDIANITQLSLSGNPIQHLDESAFSDLPMITHLDLSDITALFVNDPQLFLFKGLTKLKALDLSGVLLTFFRSSEPSILFQDQTNSLKELYLQGTELTNGLLQMLKNLTRLEVLFISDNLVGYIKRTSLPKLAWNGTLYLSRNIISYIDDTAFEGMQKESVKLDMNPLDCSCKLAAFSRWLRSSKGAVVADRHHVLCGSPIGLYGTKVIEYDPYWWQCSEYMPLVALVFIVGFLLIVALIVLIVYCNRINLKHWLLERRVVSMPTESNLEPPTESAPLLNPAMCRNSVRQGKTGAYIIHDIYERSMLDWVNKYLEDQLFNHPMKITLQFPAGPEVIPLWKQIKDFSFQVNSFLVLVTDQFLVNHWPEIAEKSSVENIMKCVFVLHGKKASELPKEMKRLQCPCFQWPETGTRFTTLERERDQFWKQVRLAVKATS
ncbi:insulin-like growth factor-binding protein complex acid labile subunit [Lineus longissimus]|uniref:insulin-like growth factor-binding protein complex acid labile subunit n=1 Tax=Lineus longissimus TaxID=88925 RepID=UPI00315CE339